ncbi:hypothetical protein CEG88_24845 [Klebsiella aerogenes]|nr:hypothetical protein CEG88_24845 [Klebsiella aerogenes]PYZ46131.1 hypothetical protein DNK66_09790 [Klebsiella aerogenes]
MRTIFYPLTNLFIHLSVSRGNPYVIHRLSVGNSDPPDVITSSSRWFTAFLLNRILGGSLCF